MKNARLLPALCSAVLALAAGCASPGAPQPPSLRLAQPVENLSATRKGDRVVLLWSPPTQTTERLPMRWPSTTRVCRVVNRFPIDQCGEPIARIPSAELTSQAPGARRPVVSFEDVLPASLLGPQSFATYALEVVNEHGHAAGLSNEVRIPLAPAVPPPSSFRASVDANGPLLQWEMSAVPLSSGATCVVRLYRRAAQDKVSAVAFARIGELPCQPGRGELRDPGFEWEREYDYKAAAVIKLAGPPTAQIEGDDTNVQHVVAHDVFPPAIPAGLQAVYSSVGQKPFIDLTWTPNTESDLAGYIVYRRTAGSDFVGVTSAPVKAPAWRDENVQPGEIYEYTVAAIDVRGNRSAQSAPTRESVPRASEPTEGLPGAPQEMR
jgi:hypothetical protein